MTTIAIGARKLGSVPAPIAIGSMPAPIATVVITIGRARFWHASESASIRERPWARRATLGFAFAWGGLAMLSLGVARYALADLASGYPEHAHFAAVAGSLALEVALVNVALAAALMLLLIQPAVRVQFSAGR